MPVVDATAYRGDQAMGPEMDAVLVNRSYLRGIQQVDRRTGERPQELPGSPLGGTSWQDARASGRRPAPAVAAD